MQGTMSVGAIAEFLGVSCEQARTLLQTGEIRGMQWKRQQWCAPRGAVEAYAASQSRKDQSQPAERRHMLGWIGPPGVATTRELRALAIRVVETGDRAAWRELEARGWRPGPHFHRWEALSA